MASGLPDPLLTSREGDGSSGEASNVSSGATGGDALLASGASLDHQARASGSQEFFGNSVNIKFYL